MGIVKIGGFVDLGWVGGEICGFEDAARDSCA